MRFRTTPPTMAGTHAVMRHCVTPSFAVLMIGLGALLGSCSESALVTQQARLHKAPASQSEVLAVIPKGSKVDASGCSDGWCRVSWNGKQGYTLAKTLRTHNTNTADDEPMEEMDGGADAD